MKTTEDVFCESFYPWWRNQTTPHKMTGERATKIITDCRQVLERRLVPSQMTKSAFDEHLATAFKAVLFSVSWHEAKEKTMDDLQNEHRIPKL